ncbi:hypothetical protein [Kangiella sp. TOML190]|uniref:pilin n=1 Tax=Kangiella sp. TOML190 TaxID=2931351 RepID=UPI0020411FE8|nr:hypothetical protein [Kangiella sp. TOML190]
MNTKKEQTRILFKRITLSLLLSLPLIGFISSCSEDKKPAVQIKKQQLLQTAWLHQQLPANALAYVRLPNPWFLTSGQDNGFEFAQSNAAHNQQVQAIQTAVMKNFIMPLNHSAKEALTLWLQHTRAPLEMALLQERPGQVMPLLVLATQFDFESREAFQASFSRLIKQIPSVTELAPMDNSGFGALSLQGPNVHYQFDAATGQFRLFAGMFDLNSLKGAAQQIKPNQPQNNSKHDLQTLQAQIDTSGQGLFAWINGKELMPILEMMVPPSQLRMAKELQLEQINALALGYGTANHKSRLRLILDMPHVGIREFLPAVSNQLSINSVGQPSSFALLSIPSYEQLVKIIERTSSASNSKLSSQEILQNLDKSSFEALGMTFADATSVLGPELIYFRDSVGPFLALRLKDKAKLQALIQRLEASGYGSYHLREQAGHQIHHLSFKFLNSDQFPANAPNQAMLQTLSTMDSHLFWIEEDNHLFLSSIPQPLIERLNKGAKTNIGHWLAKQQRQQIDNALFVATGSFKDLSRNAYHSYLEILLMLVELSGADLDIMALPTADKLGFSDYGALGMQIDSTDHQVAAELTFEQGPMDLLHAGGSVQTMAVLGILSAIAIPAYQDYLTRAKVAEQAYIEAQLENQRMLEELETGGQ